MQLFNQHSALIRESNHLYRIDCVPERGIIAESSKLRFASLIWQLFISIGRQAQQ
jgi:hypothetical protein